MMFDEFFRSVVGGGKEKSCEAVDGLKSSPQGTGGSGADYGMRVETSALVTTYVPRTGQTHASARCENVATVPQIPATPAPGTSILAACSSFVCYLVKNSIRIINVTGERALLHLPPEAEGSSIVSMSMSMTLQDGSSFLGCITSGSHLVIWKLFSAVGADKAYVKTQKVMFVGGMGTMSGAAFSGLSWWTGSSIHSPTVLLRSWGTVALLCMKNLRTLPIEKAEGGFPVLKARHDVELGSMCSGIQKSEVNDASVTSEGRVLVTCGRDGKVVLWDTPFLHDATFSPWPNSVRALRVFVAHDGAPVTACFGLKSTRQEHGLFQFLTTGTIHDNSELRLWSVARHGNVTASPAPHQTLILPRQRESSSCENLLLSMIPSGEFLVASDPTQNLLYVAHLTYNAGHNVAGLAKIDYLRPFSVSQRVLSLVVLDGNTDPDYYEEEHGGGKEGELLENAGSTEPELVVHAFLTKPVQTYHIKVSQAYPGMAPRMTTEQFVMEQQQQRASLMDMQLATHSTSTTAAVDATSGLMSLLRKDIPQKDTDWQKGRHSLGARLPENGSQSTRTIPPGVRGTSNKRLSLQSILGGTKAGKEGKEEVEKSSPRSASEFVSAKDAAAEKAVPPSMSQPCKGLLSSPSTRAHAAYVDANTSPGFTTAKAASCAGGATAQQYDSPQETSPVSAGGYPANPLSTSTPAADIVSSEDLQAAHIDSNLPHVQHVTSQTTKHCVRETAPQPVSMSAVAVKEIQSGISAQVTKLAEEGAYRGASAATAAIVPSCIQQANQMIGATVEKTLKQSVSSAFQTDVIPSIQEAVSRMFGQINATLQAGFTASPLVNESASEALENLVGVRQDINMLTQQLSSLSASVGELSQKVETLNQAQKYTAENTSATPAYPPEQTPTQIDPVKDLHPLLMEGNFEYAFDKAMVAQDLSAVLWICQRSDPTVVPEGLSQTVLICLVQHLGADLTRDVPIKLTWLHHCAICINPNDPLIKQHARPIIHHIKERLAQATGIAQLGGSVAQQKTLMFVLSSLLSSQE